MNRDKFELMAEKYNLDLNRNEHNYFNFRTQLAWEFFCANDAEHLQMAYAVRDAAMHMNEMRAMAVHGDVPVDMRMIADQHVSILHQIAGILAGEHTKEIYKEEA